MGLFKRQTDNTLFAAAPAPAGLLTGQPDVGARAVSRGQRILLSLSGAGLYAAIAGIGWLIGGKEHSGAVSLILMGVTLLVGFLAVLWSARGQLRARREHVARSVVTTGLVTSIEINGVKGDASYSARPVIRFTTETGEVVEATAVQLPRSALKRGDTTPVRYDPQDPTWMRPVEGEKLFAFLVVAGLVGFVVAPSILSIAWGVALLLHG